MQWDLSGGDTSPSVRCSRAPAAFAPCQQALSCFSLSLSPPLSPDYLNDLQVPDDYDPSGSWEFYGSSVCGEQPCPFHLGGMCMSYRTLLSGAGEGLRGVVVL